MGAYNNYQFSTIKLGFYGEFNEWVEGELMTITTRIIG